MFVLAVDPRKVTVRFDEFPQQAHKAILGRITQLTQELERRVKSAEPRDTGKLVKDTTSIVRDSAQRVTGTVKITADFAKAGALEYGAHGSTGVQSHTARLDHVFSRFVSPITVIVAAYTRAVNVQEHEYLRGPLEAMQQEFQQQIQGALNEALELA